MSAPTFRERVAAVVAAAQTRPDFLEFLVEQVARAQEQAEPASDFAEDDLGLPPTPEQALAEQVARGATALEALVDAIGDLEVAVRFLEQPR